MPTQSLSHINAALHLPKKALPLLIISPMLFHPLALCCGRHFGLRLACGFMPFPELLGRGFHLKLRPLRFAGINVRTFNLSHGPLQLYPLHACEAEKGIPLEELVEVSYIPSGSILARMTRTTAAQSGRTLLFGNPSGGLPISAWEVRKLAEKYSTEPLIGSRATFPAFCDLAKESRHFIFSGHSFFRGDCPEESGIIFSEGKILTIGNLLRDRLLPKCELVFVNGCESALLLSSSFDDHASLPTAFLQSGARCVISTLWPVDDLAAALFSVKFHELWEGGHGLCPAAALRESRLWLRGIGQGAPSSTQVLREHILPQIIGSSNDEATSASCAKSLKRLETESPYSPPFADPIYWAVFTIHGVSWESFAD